MKTLMPVLALVGLTACPLPWFDDDDGDEPVVDPPTPVETRETGETGDSGEALPDGFEQDLERTGGCGDVFMYAANESDTIALAFFAPGASEAAHAAEGATETVFDLSEGSASLVVYTGENVSHEFCNDALWLEVLVDHEFLPNSGTATLNLVPELDAEGQYEGYWPAEATLLLSEVKLSPAEDQSSITLDSLEFQAFVGWLPG
jgi:hypothetical protein